MLGAVLIVLIRQSIRTLHFDQNYEWIIIGCAIIIAVVLDQASARFTVDGSLQAGDSSIGPRRSRAQSELSLRTTGASEASAGRSWGWGPRH